MFLYYCFLQVMYDATGVRLHAGRQAEVRLFFHPQHTLLIVCTNCSI